MKAQEWGGTRELSSVVVVWIVCTVAGLSLLSIFLLVQAFLFPDSGEIELQDYQVASSSMAPGLYGPLFRVQCSNCGSDFSIAADTVQSQIPTRCLDCGGLCQVAGAAIPGQIVIVERFTARPLLFEPSNSFSFSSIDPVLLKRFDRVVIGDRSDVNGQQVKRLWGEPGERVEFREGNLWINGTLYQKNLDELKMVGVPIARYPAPRTDSASSNKLVHHHQLKFHASDQPWVIMPQETYYWQYRRPARVSVNDTSADQWLEASELVDDYPCNQGVSQRLNAVDDWLLDMRLSAPLQAESELDGASGFLLQVQHLGAELSISAQPLSSSKQPAVERPSATHVSIACLRRLKVAICDQRLLLQTDVETKVIDLPSRDAELKRSPFELNLTCRQSTPIALDSLELLRDLYLTSAPAESHLPMIWNVPEDSVFVLGDNLPVSVDSRGTVGCIPLDKLFGIVHAPH